MKSIFLAKKWEKIKTAARVVKVGNMRDQEALKNIALDKKEDVSVRIMAVVKVQDPDVWAKIAIDKKGAALVRYAAIRKVKDPDVLAKILKDDADDQPIFFAARSRLFQLKRQNKKPLTPEM